MDSSHMPVSFVSSPEQKMKSKQNKGVPITEVNC